MSGIYSASIIILILVLFITAADIMSNRLVTREMRKWAIVTCVLIGVAAIGEWAGAATNGVSSTALLITVHRVAKFLEFTAAPAIGVAVARAYGAVKKTTVPFILAAAHGIFQLLNLKFGWVFTVDAQNIYHRESLYFIYVAAFIMAITYCFACVIHSGKVYQTGMDAVLALTLILLGVGIGIQFVFSDVRIDFLCIAIANMMLYSRCYRVMLQVDSVTLLLNRRCYESNLTTLGSKAMIVNFDINKFKNVNDTYGHSVGDICLRYTAKLIREVYGKYGTCYRIGGDEFCAILEDGLEILDQLNAQFRDKVAELRKEDSRMPEVALGFAFYDKDNTHIITAIEEADAMMYRDKASMES
ncbi:MAG: GGDEF domain-containing protein [Anaerovoracaceae bacterium]